MSIRAERVRRKMPTKAVFKMTVNDHETEIALDQECLDALSRRVYGDNDMANERSLGLLVHGFIGQFIDCNEPSNRDRKDAAYQLGRRLGARE